MANVTYGDRLLSTGFINKILH